MSVSEMESLTSSEFVAIIEFLRRYVSVDMDPFENWKFGSNKGKVFVEFSLAPRGPENAYDDVGGSP
ncbi:hypothetical protein KT71_09077 [Congregibacter litoralis KT71]|uniref:Uncharacterized protein n=1 Tax=Congregibacter litoralis KT71 TaxID=314285 RepID=A4A4P6_9GAMM|nr:hypothetical protein KT71_09077 [Congregibacter litoralis KT71]